MMRSIAIVLFFVAAVNAFHVSKSFTSTRLNMQLNAISAAMVKELRSKSGAGMMDCKKALTECNGDMTEAIDFLRVKGLASAAKKADRIASTGLVAVAVSADGKAAAVVEVNSETDFVAKNDMFKSSVEQISQIAANGADTNEKILASPFEGESATVADEVVRLVAVIGENMNFRRVERLTVNNGIIASYVHSPVTNTMGKTGCLVAIETTSDNTEKLQELGKSIAMHVAASSPQFLNTDSVTAEAVEKEKTVLIEQAKASAKPGQSDEIIEKMVMGRMGKFYKEICLLEQPFIMEPKKTVGGMVQELAKELGVPVAVTGFKCMVLGEGLEERDWSA